MSVAHGDGAFDFDVSCTECDWSGDVGGTDLEDDMHEDGEGWDTNCVCPRCGGELERD